MRLLIITYWYIINSLDELNRQIINRRDKSVTSFKTNQTKYSNNVNIERYLLKDMWECGINIKEKLTS